MIKRLVNKALAQKRVEHRADLYRNLIRHEAKIGGQLFGPLPNDHQREFFCFDERTWIWHEEWTDRQGVERVTTTRYDVRSKGIFKAQDGQPYTLLTKVEAQRLKGATETYRQRVFSEMYDQVKQLA